MNSPLEGIARRKRGEWPGVKDLASASRAELIESIASLVWRRRTVPVTGGQLEAEKLPKDITVPASGEYHAHWRRNRCVREFHTARLVDALISLRPLWWRRARGLTGRFRFC